MEAKLQNKRPKHLNLFKIKQPLPAVVSILHRISGVLLFFPGIPLFAGIRHLALDLHIGMTLTQARMSSLLVVAMGVLLTVLIGMLLW